MRITALAIVCAGALLCAPSFVRAEDATPSEADEAANEEKEAAALPGEIQSPLKGIVFKGTYTAQSADDVGTIIGTFKTSDHLYLVKTESDEVKKSLAAFNGKAIDVFGKLRNKGKYLVILSVTSEQDTPLSRKKRKGF